MSGPVPPHFMRTLVVVPDACAVTKDVLSLKSASSLLMSLWVQMIVKR